MRGNEAALAPTAMSIVSARLIRAARSSPFFANSVRWRPTGTHLGRLSVPGAASDPDQQGRIDGWATGVAVVRCQMLVQLAQVQEATDAAEQVVRRNVLFEVEGIEQRRLAGFLTSIIASDFRSIDGMSVNQHQMTGSTEFFNGIDPKRTFGLRRLSTWQAPPPRAIKS